MNQPLTLKSRLFQTPLRHAIFADGLMQRRLFLQPLSGGADVDELLKRQAELNAKIEEILANQNLTDDQIKAHDELVSQFEANEKAIKMRADADERAARVKAEADRREEMRKRVESQKPTRKTSADDPNEARNVRKDEAGRVTGYIEETDESVTLRFGETADAVRRQSYKQARAQNNRILKQSGYQPWGEFKSFADFVRSGLEGHRNTDFKERTHKHYSAVTGMSEGVGSDGGYLVMPEFANKILDRVYLNDLWGRTDNYQVTGNSMTFMANAETSRATGSRHGGLRGYWLPEGGTKIPSKPTLREITLKLVKVAVVVYLTDELLQDTGTALTDYVTRKVSEEINFMLGDAIVNGNGVGQPLGLLNWPSLISVAKETGQLADTLQTENIIKMFSRFYGPNRNNMVWLYNQDIEPELFTMTLGVGTGGVVTYMPPGGLSSAPYATLMGRPMIPTEFNPTLGDQGDIIAADLGQMISISKGGIAQATSMHVAFLEDQTALRFVFRCNAGPWEAAPLTPYKGPTNTQSNAVTLDARA